MFVSVIIPVYNAEDHIEKCILSVLAQTYKPIEIICVTNNSTDRTEVILEQLQKAHPELICIHEPKQGAPFARNAGLRLAKGEYIQFLDADDYLLPEKIATQVALLQKHLEQPPFVVGNYIREKANGTELKIDFKRGPVWIALMNSDLGCTCSNLWKKNALLTCGEWNTSLPSSQEFDLMFRLLKMDERVLFDPSYNTVAVERLSGNISSSNAKRKWSTYCEVRTQVMDYLIPMTRDMDLLNSYKQAYFNSIILLYATDPAKSKYMYIKYLNGFQPSVSILTPSLYCKLMKVLGFNLTEKLWQLIVGRQ